MKTLLITGGSGKVGFQLVSHFLKSGFRVVTTSRNKKRFLEEKAQVLDQEHKGNLNIIEVDFTSKKAIETIKEFLLKKELLVNAIIHNARSLEFLKIEEDNSVSEENFAGEFFMDVIFPYRLSLEIRNIPNDLENLVFISSMYGVVAPTPSLYKDFHSSSPINYGVSKAAQIHLTKELAVRLAPEIRVNCVSFGGIKGRTDDEFLKRYHSLNPQGKMLKEGDVVGPVEFLISGNSKNMTGQNIVIDGGWSIW